MSVVAPLLTTTDLLAASTTNQASRRFFLSPAFWRYKTFTSFPRSLSLSTIPSFCNAVQLVSVRQARKSLPSFSFLSSFPNLRHVRLQAAFKALENDRLRLSPSAHSLASLHHLTRLSLHMVGGIRVHDLEALSTLPALVSFTASCLRFEEGNEATLRLWKAVAPESLSAQQGIQQNIRGEEEEEDDDEEEMGKDEEEGEEEEEDEGDVSQFEPQEVPDDASLLQRYSPLLLLLHALSLSRRYSPLLLFLHALSLKPSFVHLALTSCDLTPFVMDHMPMWPHLLCLDVESNPALTTYTFPLVALRFPSLTSLTSINCSNEAIANLIQLPKLEELSFSNYPMTEEGGGRVVTTSRGFRALSRAASLRSIQFRPSESRDEEIPSRASLTRLFTLSHLTRLTVNAWWLIEEDFVQQLLSQHRFDHLRCLELIAPYDCGPFFCPHTDAALFPLVKPADFIVPGRERRQDVRMLREQGADEEHHFSEEPHYSEEEEGEEEEGKRVIPPDNAANFPALECLDMFYLQYIDPSGDMGEVSEWMKRQLRRSYEFESAEEWEAEMATLGRAELLKTLP